MFCPHCGKKIPDGTKFCPSCGANVSAGAQVQSAASQAFKSAEGELNSAVNDVKNTFQNGTQPYSGERLTDNRGIVSLILLSIITCNIYYYYYIYKMAHDVNIACDGDGQETGGLVQYLLLSIITCGIYALYWEYKLGNRLAANAPRYGLTIQENGTTVLMWRLFGVLICGIGTWYGVYLLLKNANLICNAYNRYNNL